MSFTSPITSNTPSLLSALSPETPETPENSRSSNVRQDTSKNFMTLLVTQLQNQNPMEPMENSELLSQLTAMTSVSELRGIREGIESLQGHLDSSLTSSLTSSLISSLVYSTLGSASSLIGKQLSQDADSFTIEGDSQPLKVSFLSPGTHQAVTLRLFGDDDELIAEVTVPGTSRDYQDKSINKSINALFGTLPPGNYGLEATAGDGRQLPAFIMSAIQGVSFPAGGEPRLLLESTSPVSLSMVRQITP